MLGQLDTIMTYGPAHVLNETIAGPDTKFAKAHVCHSQDDSSSGHTCRSSTGPFTRAWSMLSSA